jgi:uncharacterized membrane protein
MNDRKEFSRGCVPLILLLVGFCLMPIAWPIGLIVLGIGAWLGWSGMQEEEKEREAQRLKSEAAQIERERKECERGE